MRRAEQALIGGLATLVAAAGAVAGCGGGDTPGASVRVDAAPGTTLRFQRGALSAASGRTSIEMRNPSDIPHAIGIRGRGVDEVGATVGRGGSSRVEADLEPGAYELFCPVGGHEEAGMTATLTIR